MAFKYTKEAEKIMTKEITACQQQGMKADQIVEHLNAQGITKMDGAPHTISSFWNFIGGRPKLNRGQPRLRNRTKYKPAPQQLPLQLNQVPNLGTPTTGIRNVMEAILTDPNLNERQQTAMLKAYLHA